MEKGEVGIVFDLYGPGWAHLHLIIGGTRYSLEHISDLADTLGDLGRMALHLACGGWSAQLVTELEPGAHHLRAEVGDGRFSDFQNPLKLSVTSEDGKVLFDCQATTVRSFATATLRCLDAALAECQFLPRGAEWRHSDPPTEQELRFWGNKAPIKVTETLRYCLQLEATDD